MASQIMASFNSWLDSIPIPVLEGESPVLQFIGRWSSQIYEEREMVLMYLHLLFSALFPIYIGSHASLRCPPSAEDPTKKKSVATSSLVGDDDDDDLDDLEQSALEGMTPSDAILFPVLASITLGGLYFLIKWLKDPALLNRILGYYFSLIGVFGVGKLAGDALNVLTTIMFPSVWSHDKEVYYIDPLLSQQFIDAATTSGINRAPLHRKSTDKNNPLPGIISMLKFPESINKLLWNFRALVMNHWVFRCYVHGITNIKAKIRLNDIMGLILGISAIVVYNNDKAWWLTNLMGFGFCYGTLQIMSPTTFWTGSLVLGGLFVYDIVMVFYTPLMVTVATSLDVPIKLVFPHSKRGGMLGLGDVVLPGIVMALALRFDLYLFYLRKPAPSAISHSLTPDSNPKPTYEAATGRWGDRFWTMALPKSALPADVAAAVFPKTYFHASMIGYVVGMVATLVVLNIFNHAQPALLYLVPSVLISLWGTSLFRGELRLMWNYTEAGSTNDEERKTKEGNDLKDEDSGKKKEQEKTDGEVDGKKEKVKQGQNHGVVRNEHAHHVFLLSLSSPRPGLKPSKFLKAA